MRASCGRLFLAAEQQDSRNTPLGYTSSGRPVWPIFGAEPDDDDDDDSDDDDDDEDDDEEDDAGKDKDKSKDKSKSKKDGEDDDDDELAAAEARAQRFRKRMQAADRRAAEAERKLAEATSKKDGEDDGSAAVVAEKDKQIESLSEANRTLRAQNAFLLNNTHQWHDPELVMGLALAHEDLEIDEDGEVHGMAEVLKRIARKKPYLVKTVESQQDRDDDDDDDDDDDTEDEPSKKDRRSGTAAGTRKKKSDVDRTKLLSTYPALHRR